MMLGARTGVWSGKPLPYDAEVEYLESTGTQWIDTGIIGNQNTKIEVITQPISSFEYLAVFGSRYKPSGKGNRRLDLILNYNAIGGWFGVNDTTTGSIEFTQAIIKPTTFISDKGSFYIDGVRVGSQQILGTFTTPTTLKLFCNDTNGTVGQFLKGNIYACKIWDNNILVLDFIPVLDREMLPAMYDRVTGKLFYNKGTGEFIIGPDKTT